jgi:gas vesicle protein
MAKDNKLVRGMLIGALVGAAVTLFDKHTRDDVIQAGKNVSSKVKGYVEEPTTLTNEVKQKIDHVKDTVQEVSEDLSFLNEKMKELKQTTPQVINLMQETKERFLPKREQS